MEGRRGSHSERMTKVRIRSRRAWPGILWVTVLLVAPATAALGGGRPLAPLEPLRTYLPAPSAVRPSVSPTTVTIGGNVYARNLSGGPDPFLAGPTVYAAARPCVVPTGCTVVAHAVATGLNASYSLALAPGAYYLWTSRFLGWGGAEEPITVVNASSGPFPLEVYPFVPYSNQTIVLPGWNPLSAYAANCNAALPCKSSSTLYGSQTPLLSWTQDGAFYVNATLELVFYSFANQTVTPIAPWLPLYDNVMVYEGVENTEWITADGTYVYEFGCRHACLQTSAVTIYAVNVTTGRTFTWDLTGVNRSAFLNNGQVDLIGEQGNHSIVAVTDDAGVVFAYNLWNQTQWVLATLPFFEANNNYWVTGLDSYFDVEAQNDPYDFLLQLRLEGPYPGTTLVKVGVTTYGKNYITGGVNGLAFNATSQQIFFTVQGGRVKAITSALDLVNGTLSQLVRLDGNEGSSYGTWPNASTYPNIESSEHRPSYLSDGPAFAGQWNGYANNSSSFVDPAHGNWVETNLTFDHLEWNGSGKNQQHQLSPAALEGLFLNTSYAIIPYSYDCRVNFSACPIWGPTGYLPGTIWWTWKSGAPEFPYPASTPIAQTIGPSAPRSLAATWNGTVVGLSWTPPANGTDPLVNYTLLWGTQAGEFNHSVSLPPTATSFGLAQPVPAISYYFRLEAWNLHWHGPAAATGIRTSAQFGYLNLSVSPAWAQVRVDGALEHLTVGGGANLTLPVGSHGLSVSSPGYQPYVSSLEIYPDNVTNLSVSLPAIAPVLAGSVSPASASVWVNGVSLGVDANGSFEETLTPGTYSITASALGYVPFGPLSVTLQNGAAQYVPIVLQHTLGWIRGRVTPAGSLVTLDGVPVAAPNGVLNLSVPTGTHQLWAGSSGYVAGETPPFDVVWDATTWENLTLDPVPGQWIVLVRPANATVAVDGTDYPADRAASGISLAPGPHELTVSAAGYDAYDVQALVAPNQTTTWNLELNRSVGWVEVVVAPGSATLWADSAPIPPNASGRYNLTLTIGSHTLRATNSIGSTSSRTVEVLDRQTVSIRLGVPGGPSPWAVNLRDVGIGAVLGAAAGLLATGLWFFRFRRRRAESPSTNPPRG